MIIGDLAGHDPVTIMASLLTKLTRIASQDMCVNSFHVRAGQSGQVLRMAHNGNCLIRPVIYLNSVRPVVVAGYPEYPAARAVRQCPRWLS